MTGVQTCALPIFGNLDYSTLQGFLGKGVDTSQLQGLMGQKTDVSQLQNILSNSNLDLSQLQGVAGQIGGNADAFVKSVTDPMQQQISSGYGDLLRGQSLRGLAGSSFGANDIANYMSTTGRSLTDAAAAARQQGLTTQANVLQNIANLQEQNLGLKGNLATSLAGFNQGDLSRNASLASAIANANAATLSNQTNVAENILADQLKQQQLGLSGQLSLAQIAQQDAAIKAGLVGRGLDTLGRGLSSGTTSSDLANLLGGGISGIGNVIGGLTGGISSGLSSLFGSNP